MRQHTAGDTKTSPTSIISNDGCLDDPVSTDTCLAFSVAYIIEQSEYVLEHTKEKGFGQAEHHSDV